MTEIRMIAGACVALLLAGLIAWGVWTSDRLKASEEALSASQREVVELKDARARDASADKVKTKAVSAANLDYNERKVKLEEAYDANEEWANSPVPSAVLDGLY